jgi:putative flippase GtrA
MQLFKEFFLFGVVGVLGFIVDSLVLYALIDTLGPIYGRLFSFAAGVLTTWIANRALTFKQKKSDLSKSKEFAMYFGLMLLGGAANYSAYLWLILHYPVVNSHPILGVAAGSIAGMFINYATSRFIIFRNIKHP